MEFRYFGFNTVKKKLYKFKRFARSMLKPFFLMTKVKVFKGFL